MRPCAAPAWTERPTGQPSSPATRAGSTVPMKGSRIVTLPKSGAVLHVFAQHELTRVLVCRGQKERIP